jgi:tetratricopeptide (TPR) repeat protein
MKTHASTRVYAVGGLTTVVLLALAACGSSPTKTNALPAASPEKAALTTTQPTPASLPQAAVNKFDQAISLLESGQVDVAEKQLTELTMAYPNFSGPYLNLGIVQMKRGDLAAAEKSLKTAAEHAPQNAKVFNQLGILYRRLGRLHEADAAYQEALRLYPDYALAHLNLGVLCDLYLGQPERALGEYERYLSLTSEPQPQVAGWVKEIKARLGNNAPASDVKAAEPAAKAAS